MLNVGLNEDAARTAYLACFHVAQALIFEASDRVTKTHQGVQAAFFRITKNNTHVDFALRRFLSRAIAAVSRDRAGEHAAQSIHGS
jgi:uncharacterized protein (UPF0332 family)